MEFYFAVYIYHPIKIRKREHWRRTFDSSWREWNDAHNRIKEIITHFGGGFDSEQIVSARGGSYIWDWCETNGKGRIIEIAKVDFGRVYDWEDVYPVNPTK